jgi:hypothetical protein
MHPFLEKNEAEKMAQKDGLTEGLICVYQTLENCSSFKLAFGKSRPRLIRAMRIGILEQSHNREGQPLPSGGTACHDLFYPRGPPSLSGPDPQRQGWGRLGGEITKQLNWVPG